MSKSGDSFTHKNFSCLLIGEPPIFVCMPDKINSKCQKGEGSGCLFGKFLVCCMPLEVINNLHIQVIKILNLI